MIQKSVVILFIFCCISTHCKATDDRQLKELYEEFQHKVIDYNSLNQKLKDSLPNDDAFLTALKMLDASSKLPSGLLVGNFFDLGNFDECYNIEFENIFGKYCLGTLSFNRFTQKFYQAFKFNETRKSQIFALHPEQRALSQDPSDTGFHFAICIPNNFDASEIPGLVNFKEQFCYSKATKPELSNGAIAMIVILSMFLIIIVASTTYDIILYYTNQKVVHELCIAFSFLTNGRKILTASHNSDQLLCLNGIKAISMMWVILGHEYSNALSAPLTNFLDISKWENNSANMVIMGATVSVDTFFTVGGLVTVYTFLKSMDKGVKFNIFLYYIHRYLRLTPIYVMIGLFHMYLLNYISVGPLWDFVNTGLIETCKKNWWSSFLYITNYVQEGICIPQTWYLSVDMQLFILSPIILLTLQISAKWGLGLLGFLSIVGCIVPFVISYVEHLGSMMSLDSAKYMTSYYIQTYTRFGPYVIGMIAGYFIYKLRNGQLKIKIKPIMVIVLWFLCLTLLTACVWAGYPLNNSKDEDNLGNAFFTGFNRPGWALALSGLIFLCVAGYGGPINSFLSLPIFQFITKLSYAMYLVHFTVIIVRYSTMTTSFQFSNMQVMHSFWGDFIITLAISFILSLSFESPVIILEKYLFGKNKPKSNLVEKNLEV